MKTKKCISLKHGKNKKIKVFYASNQHISRESHETIKPRKGKRKMGQRERGGERGEKKEET